MDSKEEILWNLREVMGLNGFRSLDDLGPMRQENLERRLTAARQLLSPVSIASIYGVWLQEQAFRELGMPPIHVVQRWCHFLAHCGCRKQELHVIWMRACLTHLDKWCNVMSPDRVRDVRQIIFEEITTCYPEEALNTAMDIDTMPPTPTPTLQGSLNQFEDMTTNAYSYSAAFGAPRSNDNSTRTEPDGRYPGYGMVRAAGATTSTPNDGLTSEELPPDVDEAEAEEANVCERCNVKGRWYSHEIKHKFLTTSQVTTLKTVQPSQPRNARPVTPKGTPAELVPAESSDTAHVRPQALRLRWRSKTHSSPQFLLAAPERTIPLAPTSSSSSSSSLPPREVFRI